MLNLTANKENKEIIKKFLSLIKDDFDIRLSESEVWKVAFFLSVKNYNKDLFVIDNNSVSGGLSQYFETVVPREERITYRNILSITHNKRFSEDTEFESLFQSHCRNGFIILEEKLIHQVSILNFLLSEIEMDINLEEDQVKIENNIEKIKLFFEKERDLKYVKDEIFNKKIKLYFNIRNIDKVKYFLSDDFLKKIEVSTALENKIKVNTTNIQDHLSIELSKDGEIKKLQNFYKKDNLDGLNFIIGLDDEDKLIQEDLRLSPHMLVAGTTGSGKTVFLHNTIKQLSDKDIELYLIDGKSGQEFGKYSHLENVNVLNDINEILSTIDSLIGIMDQRFNTNTYEPIVIIIDEFVDIIMQEKEIENLFIRIAQKGRSAKIHLILSTQRPDAKTINGLLRSNIPTRIAFKVQKSTESTIILDKTGAETLRGKGEFIFSRQGEFIKGYTFINE